MNSTIPYIDITEAQIYFDDRLNTDAWDDASDSDKLKALKTATNLINNLNFIGIKADPTQQNEFPRLGQIDVPDDIKVACCELAYQLLDDIDPGMEIDNIPAILQGYGLNARTNYARDFVLSHIRAGIPSSEAWARLLPYLVNPLTIRVRSRH